MKKSSILLFFLSMTLFAQSNQKSLEVDFARFHYTDSSNYVEIYYSFDQTSFLPKDHSANTKSGGEFVFLAINSAKQDTVIFRRYQITPKIDTSSDKRLMVGVLGFEFPFGDYACEVALKYNDQSIAEDKLAFTIPTRKLFVDRFAVSDIELASSIAQGENKNSPFYKNTYEIIPNPRMIYGSEMPVMFYYTELYNLNSGDSTGVIKLEAALTSSLNKKVFSRSKSISRQNASIIEAGAVNISKLPSGTYKFSITLTDTVTKNSTTVAKKVYIYAPNVIDTAKFASNEEKYLASEFATLTIEDVNDMFAMSKYLANKVEVQSWQTLTNLDAKKKFLFTFWQNRDANPETPENEYKNDYFKRIQQANEKFATFQKKGWQTDRGRVFCMYGEPNEVERYPSETNTKPYEIWYYHAIEGGVQFVFGDINGFSEYQLLHSDMKSELHDDNWIRRVKAL